MIDVKLIQGDCLKVMQDLIDDGVKVDLVLTDPPYEKTGCKWDLFIPFNEMWECINSLSQETTPCLLFGAEPFSSNLRLSNIKNYRYDWIWNKEIGGSIFTRKYQPLNDYEVISVFYKKAGQYYPIMEKAKRVRDRLKQRGRSNIFPGVDLDWPYKDTGLRFPKRTIFYNSQEKECNNLNRVHPTQKPVELLKYLIKTYTKEDDVVLDFTMGSGSTGVACVETNRNFIGIELEPKYYEIAEQRIKEAKAQRRLI